MRIKRIQIRDFRSIEEIDINTDNLNTLVGQNNHGKTNFLSSISWFFDGGSVSLNRRKGKGVKSPPYVAIEFDGVQNALSKMKNEKNSKTLASKLKDYETVTLARTVDEDGKSYRKILDVETGDLTDPGTGFDRALNDFLPHLEFVQTENSLREVLKYGKTTQIGTMLSGVLSEILASGDPKYKQFVNEFYELFGSKESRIYKELAKLAKSVENYLKKQFPETTNVEFEVKNPELTDLFKNFSATVDDGIVTEAYEKGDGMQRALMLAIIQTFADYRRENADIKNFIFLIDEGELHLHPGAQRNLKSALIDLANDGDQIFLTTHSSVLIADENPHDEQSIFKVEKYEDGITVVEKQDKYTMKSLVYELLGGSPTDLLLPSNFLIVEGPSEEAFLNRVISRHYSTGKEINILPAQGDILQVTRLSIVLDKMFSILSSSIYEGRYQVAIDLSKIPTNEFNELIKRVPNFNKEQQLHELPVGSLEEYYPLKQPGQCDDPSDSRTYIEKWKLTSAETANLSPKQKKRMAKLVGEYITKEQFETEMPVLHRAITMAQSNAL